ncbi:hypothetical protein NQ317_000743 [Molorchus minor]|uniref:Tubulin-folding cofactor D ARM repeats domain-containing protein n=1 Tax=Molorchus minor TaxID=1323400 RepID=A0ABQ9JBN1_9CUCU|nr:hypothetical protein NQ317_000743 [Molorchus minor]
MEVRTNNEGRGLLLPDRLPQVVPVVLKALVYDEPRGYSSVGSHIRDAACYVCWSFARAYETHILAPYVNDIAREQLLQLSKKTLEGKELFLMELIYLPQLIFFSVSVRNNAYLNVSVYIAQFEEYTLPLIEHLVTRKVDHWDAGIRELTAKTLHNLTPKYLAYSVFHSIALRVCSDCSRVV